MSTSRDDANDLGHASATGRRQHPRRIDISELLAGAKEAVLVHNGEHYRLRVTSNGKLILTK